MFFFFRVLLLDFDGKFTLLIPNIELGKAFRINKADVEVHFHNSLRKVFAMFVAGSDKGA